MRTRRLSGRGLAEMGLAARQCVAVGSLAIVSHPEGKSREHIANAQAKKIHSGRDGFSTKWHEVADWVGDALFCR